GRRSNAPSRSRTRDRSGDSSNGGSRSCPRRLMKYLCLVYLEEEKLRAVPDRECMACGEGFRKSGLLGAAEALEPVGPAATVRVRNGRMTVVDGPFAETTEQLAASSLITTRDV